MCDNFFNYFAVAFEMWLELFIRLQLRPEFFEREQFGTEHISLFGLTLVDFIIYFVLQRLT